MRTNKEGVPVRQLVGLFIVVAIPAIYLMGRPIDSAGFQEWNSVFFGTLCSIPAIFIIVAVLGICFYNPKKR